MKKILAIIGSGRKGETYKAVQKFEEELNKLSKVQIEYLMLRDYEFKDCIGCHNCIKRGEQFCPENKKVKELQDKILQADAVILATPVYNQHVTAIMKKFMDYFTFLWHRPALFGVKFFAVSSGGGMFGPVFKYLKMNVDAWGGTWVDSLGVPHYESLTDKFRKNFDKDIKKKADILLKALEESKLPKPSLGRLLNFNMWKINAYACREDIVKDYEHWAKSNWFNMDYYYDTKIGIFKRIFVKFMKSIMTMFMRKVYKGY